MMDMTEKTDLKEQILFASFNHPESGYKSSRETAQFFYLLVGVRYEVDKVVMGASYTDIYLCGYPRPFNSVLFDFEDEDGTAHDIYGDPKYNPFLNRKENSD